MWEKQVGVTCLTVSWVKDGHGRQEEMGER